MKKPKSVVNRFIEFTEQIATSRQYASDSCPSCLAECTGVILPITARQIQQTWHRQLLDIQGLQKNRSSIVPFMDRRMNNLENPMTKDVKQREVRRQKLNLKDRRMLVRSPCISGDTMCILEPSVHSTDVSMPGDSVKQVRGALSNARTDHRHHLSGVICKRKNAARVLNSLVTTAMSSKEIVRII